MKKLIIISAVVMMLFSCEEKIDIDLGDQGEPKIVIDGFITTDPGPHYIRISKTVPYYAEETFDPVKTATVTLSEDGGTPETLTEVEPGVYESLTQGQVGATYELTVVVDGETYTGIDRLPQGASIDSIGYFYEKDNPFRDDGYHIRLYAKEPAGEDYYRMVIYENGKRLSEYDNFIVTDDKFVDGNYINGIEFDQTFDKGDTVTVQMLTTTRQVFKFYQSIEFQANSGGGFDPPPANLSSTISNEGFGYFGAFGSDTATVVIR